MLGVLSDYELVQKTKEGSTQAFCVLVQRYEQALIHMCLRYVGNLQAAEDVVQESLLKAYEKINTFEFRSAFKSWLYRIVINTAKNSLRSQKVTIDINIVELHEESECEKNLIDQQLISQALDLVEALPDKQKQALQLRVLDDLSFAEVAESMDCPYDTAKANYRHGLLKLKEQMIIAW